MLHTKPQGQRPFGSGEEGFLPYMGMANILVMHVTKTIRTNFRFRTLRSLYIKFELNWPIGFREGDV